MQTIRFVIIWLFISLLAWCNAARAQVVINEYSCSNLANVTDNYGQYEDWFELYNASASSIDLTGYYLTNKASNPTKWQFPSGTIAAGGVLRIWASENDIVAGGNYHVNFKLQQTKPHVIVLSDPAGVMKDSVQLRRHKPDHSWGRTTDGATTWGVFTTPTSNASNNTQTPKQRYAYMPSYSLPGGFYASGQNVSLTSTETGAIIYYTTNGFAPTTASTVYTGPISAAVTTVIKSFAVSSDPTIEPGFYDFQTFFINVPHTVPVVSVAGDQITTLLNGSSWTHPLTSVEYYEADGTMKTKTVGICDKHGNDSWAYPQRGFDFAAYDQYGYSHYLKHKIFPRSDRDEFQRVIFKAGASDNYPFGGGSQQCHLRDAFVHDYGEKIGLNIDGRRVNWCQMYVNGQYWGFYETREKMDDHDYTEYYYDQPKDSIDLLKFWGGLQIDYGTNADWNNLYAYIMANPMTNQAAYDNVKNRLSFSNFIDYCIFNTYIVNSDWINWNTMWWRGYAVNGDHKKWHYSFWDEDNTFNLGQNYSGWQTTGPTADPCDLANNFSNAGPNMATMDILEKLLTNAEFHQDYINRYADLMNGKLSCDSVIQHLDWFESIMTPEMPAQCARWGGTVTEWHANVQAMRDFIESRCSFIAGSITGCYDVTGPYQLTVIIDPPNTGKVQVNSFLPPGFPYTGTYFGSSASFTMNLHLQETPNPDYIFGYWIPGATITAVPNILSDTLSITLTGNDTIIAHFKYWPAVGVYATDEMDITILPTVSSDLLIVNFNNLPEGVSTLRLYNLTGQQVADIATPVLGLTTGRRTTSLTTLGLAPGMYLVELTAGSHKQIQKIVYQPD